MALAKVRPQSSATGGATETVREPARIAGLLSAITFPPLLVNVALPGVRGLYNSAILQVNSASGRILLDGLSPIEGHAHIEPGSMLHLHGKLRGVHLDFATRVVEIQGGDRPPAYVARMPTSLRYHQRRRHFRIHTGHLHDYATLTLGASGGPLRGRLRDLSLSGLKAVLPRDPGLVPGQRVTGCQLGLFGETCIEFELHCVHLRPNPITGELQVGGRIEYHDPRDKIRLERSLTMVQRRQLRGRLPD